MTIQSAPTDLLTNAQAAARITQATGEPCSIGQVTTYLHEGRNGVKLGVAAVIQGRRFSSVSCVAAFIRQWK